MKKNSSGGFSDSYLRYLENIKHENIFGSWYDHCYLNYGDFLVLDSLDQDPPSPPFYYGLLDDDDEVVKKSPKIAPVMPKTVGFEDSQMPDKRISPK